MSVTPWERQQERKELEAKRNEIISFQDYWGNKGTAPWHRTKAMNADQMEELLLRVSQGESLQVAAQEMGFSLLAVMRQRLADEQFCEAMNEAIQIRELLLEDKLFELAYHGHTETVTKYGKGDEEPVVEHRTTFPNNSNAQFLLKSYNRERFGDKQEIKAGPLEGAPMTIKSEDDRVKLVAMLEARRNRRALPPTETGEPDAESTEAGDDERSLQDLL